MRNLIILGCAGLLALGLSFGSFAGSITDNDGDGVPDQFDNCRTNPNGPLASSGLCDGQEDADLDGYGNPCDFDPSNDGQSDLGDLSSYIDNVGGANDNFDNDCDGQTSLADLDGSIDNSTGGVPPGPSDLPCAGTVPCVAE